MRPLEDAFSEVNGKIGLLLLSREDVAFARTVTHPVVLLPLSVDAEFHCTKAGLEHVPFSSLFDSAEIEEAGHRVEQEAFLIFQEINSLAKNKYSHLNFNIWDHASTLKMLLDRITIQSYAIQRAVREFTLRGVAHSYMPAKNLDDQQFLGGGLFPVVAKEVARGNSIQIFAWENRSPSQPGQPDEDTFAPAPLPLHQRISNKISRVLGFIKEYPSAPHNGKGRTAVLDNALSSYYANMFRFAGCSVATLRDIYREGEEKHDPAWGYLLDDVANSKWFVSGWNIWGIDFSPVIFHVLNYIICQIAPQYAAAAAETSTLLKKLKNPFILTYSPVLKQHVTVVDAAQSLGIPVFVLQHGGFGHYMRNPILLIEDLKRADYFIGWGARAKESLRSEFQEFPNRDVAPEILSCTPYELLLAKRQVEKRAKCRITPPDRKLNVLYISGALHGDKSYITPAIIRDHTIAEIQKIAVDTLGCLDANVTIRTYPGQANMGCRNPLQEYAQDMNYNIQFDRRPPVIDQILWSDVIIVDNPTTVFVQAALTRKPIAAFVMEKHLKPEARDMVMDRACVAFSLEDFPRAIHEAFHQGLSKSYTPDDKFLNAYVLSSRSDSYSVCRAVLQALEEGTSHSMKQSTI
ncbi:MAG: hypothetical protein ACM31D_06625 [Bacteroidota bacterium]